MTVVSLLKALFALAVADAVIIGGIRETDRILKTHNDKLGCLMSVVMFIITFVFAGVVIEYLV